ncbi:DUF2127 domain-containing protein [Pseudonocardia sp. GCM10023141]|uniref:DUF2127 domain-containing protein n=1 Tax=Pseudonocardia sp. GCM10023141 TaxID=3252653 RepID=UPI0036073A31
MTDRLFKIALIIKGLDGGMELLGAILLLFISPKAVDELTAGVLSRDLLGPPDGSLAQHFASATAEFATGSRTFAVIYLGLHGLVKLALVWALLRKIMPAYPVAVVVLGVFVVYEVIRTVHTGSVLLPFLAALDVAVIVMVIREYRELRATSGR